MIDGNNGCVEDKPVYPRCYKYGKEIKELDDTVWRINGMANYGSHYDYVKDNNVWIICVISVCLNSLVVLVI